MVRITITIFLTVQQSETCMSGVSLMFSTGGQLLVTGVQNDFELNICIKNFPLDSQSRRVKSSSQPVSLGRAWRSMKPLACTLYIVRQSSSSSHFLFPTRFIGP